MRNVKHPIRVGALLMAVGFGMLVALILLHIMDALEPYPFLKMTVTSCCAAIAILGAGTILRHFTDTWR